MSKPIIATSLPIHQRIFEKGPCGLLVDSGNPKALSKAIIYLYYHREKIPEMGKIGRKIVEEYYTWDKKAQELEIFLKTLIWSADES